MSDNKVIVTAELKDAVVGLDVLQDAKDEIEAGEVIELKGPKKLLRKLDLILMPMM